MALAIPQFTIIIILLCTINRLFLNVTCDENENTYNADVRMMQAFKLENIIGNYLKSSGNNSVATLKINNECRKQILIFLNGIANYELWTIKMLDASSKIPSGILEGNTKDIGMYDECLSVSATKKNTTITGRHCMYTLSNIIPESQFVIEPMLSVCLPAACDANDVNNLLQSIINTAMIHIDYSNVTVKSVTCSNIDVVPYSIGTIITTAFLILLSSFFIFCTICQLKMNPKENETNLTFWNVLLISGLRFFSTCWIVLGHTYHNGISELMINRVDVLTWVRSWTSIYVIIGHFAVDTFLVLSSVLVCYFFFSLLEQNKIWDVIYLYGHRYLKLTPSLFMLLLLTIYIFPYFGSGPLWEPSMTSQSNYCKKNWWRILLYIQNYGSNENLMCLGYTWYLAVDMQLFFLTPIVFIPLLYKEKVGLTILGLLIIISMIIPAFISVTNKYSISLQVKLDSALTADMMLYQYVPTHTRAGPYLMGLLTGYRIKHKKTLSNAIIKTGWILTVFSLIFSTLSWKIFQMDSYNYNIYWELFYTAFSQHIWSFAICWIIYASAIGRGGPISTFLSLKFFIPFTRLTYAIYLVHFVIQTMEIYAMRTPKYFSNYAIITMFISDFALSIITAFIFHLFFESPYLVIRQIMKNDENNTATNTVSNTTIEADDKITDSNRTSD